MAEFIDDEEIEEVVIGDEEESEDRGDDFVPTDDDADEVVDLDAEPEPDAEVEKDAEPVVEKEGEPEPDEKGVPFSRLNEVSRTKTAATQIADAIVEGQIDPQTIKDLGGANAVAKAMANREFTLDDLKTGTVKAPATATGEGPASWDLNEKYVEYQEKVELGQIKEAAVLLRDLNKEERRREREDERAQEFVSKTQEFVNQLIADHPTAGDVDHPDHESMMAWTNYYTRDRGLNRIEALKKASTKVFTAVKPTPIVKEETETTQQRVIRERREASLKKNAKASAAQPPKADLGAGPADEFGGKDISKLPDEEYAKVSEREKAIARGDIVGRTK